MNNAESVVLEAKYVHIHNINQTSEVLTLSLNNAKTPSTIIMIILECKQIPLSTNYNDN